MDQLQITKPQLKAAMLQWELESRDGKTMTPAEAAAMSAEEHSTLSTDALWVALGGVEA